MYIKEDSASAVTGTANSSSTSLTLTTSNTSANVTVTPNSANGTFAMSSTSNEAKFSVTTNNYTGYELRIKADDDNGNLVNIDNGNTHTISSIPSSITKSSFDTTTYNNKWGYKPNKYLGPNSTIVDNTGDSALFLPSPTTSGTVLDHTTTPNTTANNYTIALGIRADHNTYAGTYTKTFTLVATANPTTYTINYNKNTTDSVSNMPVTSTTGSTTSTSITLPNAVPTRAHYSFLGWCSTTPTTSNGIDSCSGTVYNPNGAGTNLTYGIDQTTANTTTLYAMWELEKFTITLTTSGGANGIVIDGANYSGSSASLAYGNHTISGSYASGYEFDSWATSGSVSVASISSASTTLTVTGVGTLTLNGKSSKLWFQNATSAQCGQTMYDDRGTDAYKNIAYTTASINGLCWMTRNLDLPGGTTLTAADSNVSAGCALGGTNNCTLPASSTSGFSDTTAVYVYNSNNTTCASNSPCYSYYSYAAATAGTNPSSGEAASDICPKGWRLPTYAELTALKNTYTTGATLTAAPLYGVYAGYYYNSSFYYGGSRGYYWSSTVLNASYAYDLYFNSSNAGTYNGYKSYGYSVRCVLDQVNSIADVRMMQKFGELDSSTKTAVVNSMTEGQAYTLTDSRDGTSYTVSKLADGKVWLLDNLALDLTNSTVKANLSATNTNASNTTLNYLKNGGGTTSDQYAITGVVEWTSSPNYASSYSYSDPLIATSGAGNNGDWTKDTLQSYGSGSGKIGVYYNYCAASAGSYCYSYENAPSSGNATEDICPKGWRMPTSGSSGEYQSLYTAYSSNDTNFKNALRTPLSGSFINGSAGNQQGSYGYFWSSTYRSGYHMYYLSVGSSYASPKSYGNRYYGSSVRCVLQ